jgi:hypothetical protein
MNAPTPIQAVSPPEREFWYWEKEFGVELMLTVPVFSIARLVVPGPWVWASARAASAALWMLDSSEEIDPVGTGASVVAIGVSTLVELVTALESLIILVVGATSFIRKLIVNNYPLEYEESLKKQYEPNPYSIWSTKCPRSYGVKWEYTSRFK